MSSTGAYPWGISLRHIQNYKALPIYQQIRMGCDISVGQSLAANEMLRPDWQDNRFVRDFFARNTPGEKAARGPLLLISSDDDSEVPWSLTSTALTRLCAQKDRVLSIHYPGLSASAVIGNSAAEQISWLRARFAGTPAPSNCP